ncbi:ATP synthase subunit delta [Azospirillaceae bacterium]
MASRDTGAFGLAARYATALFELAKDQAALDDIARDLTELKRLLAESSDLQRVISSPVLSRGDQARAVNAVLDAANVSDLTRRFVGLTVKNRRANVLRQMADAFLARLATERGETTAEIVAAQPLTEAQIAGVTESLRQTAGAMVNVRVAVDPGLIGGMIVKVGSRLIDNSLRTKLNKLQIAMKAPEGAV